MPGMMPWAPAPKVWSITFRPSCPLELPSPLENPGVLELRRIRADSRDEAQTKMIRAWNSSACSDSAAITRTPGPGLVVDHAVHDAVGPEGHPPGPAGGGQGGADAVEIGVGDAAPLARTAVVARGAAVVVPGEDRHPADREDPLAVPLLQQLLARHPLGTAHLHRREELAVGKLRQSLRLAADPDELLHVVVPRGDVGVADRPVHRDPVLQVGLEVE